MSYTMAEFAKAHKAWHEGGGRRNNRVRATHEQVVTVVEVLPSMGEGGHVRDGVYCRYKREGSDVVSAPIRWNDPYAPPVVDAKVLLKAWNWFSATGDNSLLMEYFGIAP